MRILAACCAAGCLLSAAAFELVSRDVYLMGTRARLSVHAATREEGFATIERALRVLEQADRQLSTWNSGSDISALNRTPPGSPWKAPADLCALFGQLYSWRERTGGAFDPAMGALIGAWDIHGKGRVPSPEEIRDALARSGLARIEFDRATCTLTRRHDARIDVGAFGKGEALDRVARELPATPWMIDLGGQVSVGGPHPTDGAWTVDIAHPSDRAHALMQVRLTSGSLSTSGGSERDLEIGGVRVGHILDPQTGRPATFRGSVVVWHEQGLAADILSTALYVMGPERGRAWANALGIAAAYLVSEPAGVRTVPSDAFAKLR